MTSPATKRIASARGASTTSTVPIATRLSSQPIRMNSRVRAISSSRIASTAVPSGGSVAGRDAAGAAGASERASGATDGTSPSGNSAVVSPRGSTPSAGSSAGLAMPPVYARSARARSQLELEAETGDERVGAVAAGVVEPLQIGLQAHEVGQRRLVEPLDEPLVGRAGAAAERLGDPEAAGADAGGVVVARPDAMPRRRAAGVAGDGVAIRARPARAEDDGQAARVALVAGVQVDALVVLDEPAGVVVERARHRRADFHDVARAPPHAGAGRPAVAIERAVVVGHRGAADERVAGAGLERGGAAQPDRK